MESQESLESKPVTGNGYVEMTGYAGKLTYLAMAIGRDLRNLGDPTQLAVTRAIAFSLPSPAGRIRWRCCTCCANFGKNFSYHPSKWRICSMGFAAKKRRKTLHFVAAMAEKLELPFHLKEIDLPQMKSDAGKGNLEALARAERYRFFAEVVKRSPFKQSRDRAYPGRSGGDRVDVVFARRRHEGIRRHGAAATTVAWPMARRMRLPSFARCLKLRKQRSSLI